MIISYVVGIMCSCVSQKLVDQGFTQMCKGSQKNMLNNSCNSQNGLV